MTEKTTPSETRSVELKALVPSSTSSSPGTETSQTINVELLVTDEQISTIRSTLELTVPSPVLIAGLTTCELRARTFAVLGSAR